MTGHFRTPRSRATTVAALALPTALLLTACGADGEDAPAEEVEADEELADLVPEEFAESGVLRVGVNAEYPPGEYLDTDGQTVVGFNVDLFDSAVAKLGLTNEWVPAEFEGIIVGVQSGEYDAGVSSFTVNAERMEEVHMVSYLTVGTQWFAQEGNPQGVDPESACGLAVAVEQHTVQHEDLEERSEACVDAGEEPIDIQAHDSQEQATATIQSGVNDAGLADLPVAIYAMEQTDGEIELIGDMYEDAPYGAVVNHENTELAEAIQAGYQAIMDDGTYEEILTEWGATEGSLDTSELDPLVGE
ncbi:ABC transporter substrate-binding protein [Spiractinospora alimapuensis]|uniref:ABC transporter substrate-binding protein n=1 Tax=Spiractinospora alimapuensis TaxID=2820884 RepID=UPI001F46FF92|nr:ABC transporter substrate-binding protein [Spiractinospora alimapuensis]QVQ54105.1 ABC transporter substrate-binding protein [Spiractinospora alimapuensis]